VSTTKKITLSMISHTSEIANNQSSRVMFARRLDLARGDVCGGLLIQINDR
jgi:hypothetical protein